MRTAGLAADVAFTHTEHVTTIHYLIKVQEWNHTFLGWSVHSRSGPCALTAALSALAEGPSLGTTRAALAEGRILRTTPCTCAAACHRTPCSPPRSGTRTRRNGGGEADMLVDATATRPRAGQQGYDGAGIAGA